MAPGPRLYVLDVGSIGVKNGAAVPAGRGRDMYRVPVAAYVITHPAGNVLYDTGMDVGTIDNPAAVWGSLLDRLVPYMREEDHILRRLQSIGLSPRDISYVFLSHLHCDHAGGIRLFPDAEFVLQRTELETPIPEEMSLFYPEPYRDARYDGTLAECVRSVRLVEGDLDLFGDGRVIAVFTPGHSPGHQSLVVRLDSTGDVLIAGDACINGELVDGAPMVAGTWRRDVCHGSRARIKALQEQCALSICGHDPDLWCTLRHAPEYYD